MNKESTKYWATKNFGKSEKDKTTKKSMDKVSKQDELDEEEVEFNDNTTR